MIAPALIYLAITLAMGVQAMARRKAKWRRNDGVTVTALQAERARQA